MFITYCFAFLLSCGNAAQQKNSTSKSQGKSLEGFWFGNFQKSGSPFQKSWQITRLSDGTFTKNEIWKIKGRMQRLNKSGIWWTKDGVYYEQDNQNKTIEMFEYKLLKNHQIEFKSKNDSTNIYIENQEKKE